MKMHYRMVFSVIGFLSILFLLISGCGSSASKNPTDNGNNDNDGDTSGFISASQQTILNGASNTFSTLLKTSSRTAARETLIKQLNATAGVKSATLFEDGYTVWVTFSDSSRGIVNTIDSAELAKGIESVQYGTLKKAIGNGPGVSVSTGKRLSDPITPGERKVLILDIAEPTVPCAGNIQRMRSLFLNNGWRESDITVKIRASQTDMSITPQDMFSLGQYGVVIIYAHGIYGRVPGSSTSSPYHYIQLCSALTKSDPNAELYQKWFEQGLLVPSSEGVYIRSDLLMERLQHMPGSIVYLCTCYGWHARDAFISNGCGAFLG